MSTQPKRGEGPFIRENSDGCSGLSIPYRWINKTVFKRDAKLFFLDACLQHDERYWHGGSWMQRKKADADLFHGVAKAEVGNNFILKALLIILASIMWIVVRIMGSPRLPTRFRWMRGNEYTSGINYTKEDMTEDMAVDTNDDAKKVMQILNDPNTAPSTVEEAVVEFKKMNP